MILMSLIYNIINYNGLVKFPIASRSDSFTIMKIGLPKTWLNKNLIRYFTKYCIILNYS